MASSPLQQILSTAIDADGVSVVTTPRSPTDPRPGNVYDLVNLAAAVPVYFFPTTSPSLGGTNYLMLNSQRWTAATSTTSDPGAYTAYTSTSVPSWVLVNAATGHTTVINSGYEIPMNTANDSRTLTAATSRGNDFLWPLYSVAQGDDTVAVVQHWHNNTAINTINLRGEETIPRGTNGADTVVFSAGLHWSASTTPYMHFYGLGSSTNHVYMARKTWARVGYVGTPTSPLDTQWEYFTGTGWVHDPTQVQPINTALGPMVSVGPLSFAHYFMTRTAPGMSRGNTGHTFVATVQASGSARSAQVHSSLGGRPWQPVGSPIALGASGSTYLGGNIQFQSAVGANPALIDATTSASAVPYCYSVKVSSGGADSIDVNWALLQIPRLS